MSQSILSIEISDLLVRRARNGDTSACEQIYRRYSLAVLRLCTRILHNQSDSEDAMQEIFIVALKRLPQFQYKAPFAAWLRKIAVNHCIDRIRKQQRLNEVGIAGEDEFAFPQMDSQWDLAEAFGRLTPQARAIVWLYEVEGYSHEEIAQAFDRSVSFSKMQLHRARESLRQLLTHEEQSHVCTAS